MTYTEAKAKFVPGMSATETGRIYGAPTFVNDFPETVRWEYVPLKEIEKGGKSSYSGFTIVFVAGKTTAIWERETVAR